MTIKFMVLGMPRSGTAWAANWLTTDTTLCHHDPLWKHHYSELDSLVSEKVLGVSCTGLALFPEFVNGHAARKVVLRRPLSEVNASLTAMGTEPLPARWVDALEGIKGMHVAWKEIFDPSGAGQIYEFLLEQPFDRERHAMLVSLNVQLDFEKMRPDPTVTQRLFQELRAHRGAV